ENRRATGTAFIVKLKLPLVIRGRFSVVKRCDHRSTNRSVAVKHINKKLMRRDQVTQELNLLWRLKHPHIVSLLDIFETSSSYALVLEL
uniref:Protein kinase domain-containing protein n=1 Tax=Oryzias latipes TaxID=8090 RepID=A0A3P9J1U1_ORYLA